MRAARVYFALQAVAGAAWWIAVFVSPMVREATLGALDPVLVAVFDIPLFVTASATAAYGVRPAAVVVAGWTTLVAVALAVYATLSGEAGWGVILMIAAAATSLIAACLLVFGRVPTAWMANGPFRFRLARTRTSRASHVIATFAQIVVFWGFFLVALPVVIAALEHRWALALPVHPLLVAAGAVVLVFASALGLWAAAIMSSLGGGTPLPAAMPNRLVIAGPYRWVRNPMALSGIVQGAAVGLVLSSWLVVAYAVAGSLLWNYAIRPLEEADLEARFGDDFRRYRRAVRCWVPRRPAAADAPAPTPAPATPR